MNLLYKTSLIKYNFTMKNKSQPFKIAIIGGGLAGCVTAIKLAKLKNVEIDIYEKRNTILNSLPYCHLHLGGFLYPELSLKECEKLFSESLTFISDFHKYINQRPTIIAYKSKSDFCPKKLLVKTAFIKILYTKYKSKLQSYGFPNPEYFYSIYTREDIEYFKTFGKFKKEQINDKYTEYFCQSLNDIDDIKYPFICVWEPGIDQTSLENQLSRIINNSNNINIHYNTKLSKVHLIFNKETKDWNILFNKYNYLINASGHDSRNLFKCDQNEFLEMKCSWLINVPFSNKFIPEVALIGPRGTENGLIQLTPIINENINENTNENIMLFQIHYMSNESSIINKIHNTINNTIQNDTEYKNIFKCIDEKELNNRLQKTINYIHKTFNNFKNYTIPQHFSICGIQRTVSDNHSFRNSNIIFNNENYMCEIRLIKAIGISYISNHIFNQIVNHIHNRKIHNSHILFPFQH